MSKLINKALVFKEWKTARLMIGLMFLCIFFYKTMPIVVGIPVLEDNLQIEIHKQNTVSSPVGTQMPEVEMEKDKIVKNADKFIDLLAFSQKETFDIMMIVLLAIFSFLQMFPERWGKNESITYSLPVDRGLIMYNKIMIGLAAVVSIFILNGAVILIKYLINADLLGSYIGIWDIIKWVTRSAVAYSTIYSLFMFVHAVCGNLFTGVLLGPAAMLFPLSFVELFKLFFRNVIRLMVGMEAGSIIVGGFQRSSLLKGARSVAESISLFMYSGQYGADKIHYGTNIKAIPVIESLWGLNMAILVPGALVFSSLAIYYFHKNKLERKNWFIQFKSFRVLFIVCFTIVFTMLGNFFSNQLLFSIVIRNTAIEVFIMLILFIAGLMIALRLSAIGRRVKVSLNPLNFFRRGAA